MSRLHCEYVCIYIHVYVNVTVHAILYYVLSYRYFFIVPLYYLVSND